MSTVAAEGVTRTFGDFTAVDGVDLEVARGEVVGLLGANGAGKTTLIRLLLGVLRPSSGDVRLFGAPPSAAERRRVGYVPQNLGLYRDLTVRENLEFRAELFGAEPSDFARDNPTVVGRIPLGVQRQAAFEAATQHHPELLILDEPTSGVSPLARSRLWNVIRAQSESGVAVLVSTHYMDEAEQADRVVIMAGGRVVAAGTVPEIIGGRSVVEVTADDWPAALSTVEHDGRVVLLDGRVIRVLGDELTEVRADLDRAGISASTRLVPASLNETLVALSRDAPAGAPARDGEQPA
ncbi:MAG TPA: ABC transporter ATP-binding protein [Acidimicrobiia bacterium]|nr:ABC transporter ATP-binding protein [Acidimicrobiia bacterium]